MPRALQAQVLSHLFFSPRSRLLGVGGGCLELETRLQASNCHLNERRTHQGFKTQLYLQHNETSVAPRRPDLTSAPSPSPPLLPFSSALILPSTLPPSNMGEAPFLKKSKQEVAGFCPPGAPLHPVAHLMSHVTTRRPVTVATASVSVPVSARAVTDAGLFFCEGSFSSSSPPSLRFLVRADPPDEGSRKLRNPSPPLGLWTGGTEFELSHALAGARSPLAKRHRPCQPPEKPVSVPRSLQSSEK